MELPKTAMESEGCVCGHEGCAQAVAGRSSVLVQLKKLKGLESEGKLIICLVFGSDSQWGGTRLRKCFYSSSLKNRALL